MGTDRYNQVTSHSEALAATDQLIDFVVYKGPIEIGTPQSSLLISIHQWLKREDNPLRLPVGVDSRQ